MDWITEHIAIGNFLDAGNAAGKIDAILCLKPECCDEGNSEIDIYCIPLIDGPGNDREAIDDAVDYIHEVVSDGETILVHCHAGRSRSVCVVARYFMVRHNMSQHDALSMIEQKREIYLSPGIEEILEL